MEEMTIQRRTITIPKEKVRCKIKWTDRQRIPRKLKKKYKKRGILNPWLAIAPAIRQILEFKDMRFLTDFLTTDNSKLYCKGIEEYGK